MLRKIATVPVHTFFRFLLRTVPLDDPWARFPHDVPLHRYGTGARRDFAWYFEGDSSVEVTGVEEVCDWLRGCAYIRDPELFYEVDFWQHPCTFEHLRKGDCEDFALWAWRKLVELGYEAEFVAGRSVQTGRKRRGHAWVQFHHEDEQFVLDACSQQPGSMVRALEAVRTEYVPEVSVDGAFRRFAYGGYYRQLRARKLRPSFMS